MSEVIGYPGGGLRLTSTVGIFCGFGNPNQSSTPDVARAGIASLFLMQDNGSLFICSAGASLGIGGVLLSPSVWTQLT